MSVCTIPAFMQFLSKQKKQLNYLTEMLKKQRKTTILCICCKKGMTLLYCFFLCLNRIFLNVLSVKLFCNSAKLLKASNCYNGKKK